MASKHLIQGLKRSALTVALGLSFVGAVQAQTNTAGAVGGRATAGDTITVSNPATGFTRTITVGADGTYRFAQLPTGQYTVSRNNGSPRTVNVSVGGTQNVDFVAAGGGDAQTLDTVTVVGSGAVNPIDISSVESTTILTAEQIKKIPVAQNTTAVALLAPGTVRGDGAFGNLASFGGSSVAENQYYINGFNITNSFRSLNFSQVPFEAIAEQQIKTGGYGAEFGRSLGGVINQITKRGTNEFHAGGNIYYTPEELSETSPDAYLSNPLSPNFGRLRSDNSKDNGWQYTANAWASGALVKDKLFAYALISYGKQNNDAWGAVNTDQNTATEQKNPKWLLKMDWNITDNHILELTAFSDKSKQYIDTYNNTPGQTDRFNFIGTTYNEQGGENYVLKYTGYLTDTFTLSALAGRGEFSRSQKLIAPDGSVASYDGNIHNPDQPGCPIVGDGRSAARIAATGLYSSSCNISGGQLNRLDSGDTRKQYRLDAEWQLGDHLIRFGYDRDDYESIAGVALEGGSQWTYLTDDHGTDDESDDTDIVQQQIFSQGSTVKVKQHAYYIEDSWNITDNFIAYIGGRWDTFENINGIGATYVKIKDQFGPRLGFSWDVFGDSTFKVFGNAGRYALPLTPSVAVRGASASIFSVETFTFTGVNPVTGEPTGLVSNGDQFFANGEDGFAKAPQAIASKNLDPMYQDEYILGFQKQLTDHFSIGVRGIFRDLKAAIDDNCDAGALLTAAGFQNVGGHWMRGGREAVLPNPGFPYCRMFNPGNDAVWVTDFFNDGNFETTTVPGSALAPKAKRTYSALEVFFDGNWDKLFLQGSYTYAKSKGNTEGGVKSDIGQGDTSTTQDFDYLELMTDTYGYLPNDRRHSLKLFGSYQLTDEWAVGANLLVQSGRPVNCFGVLDLDPGPDYVPHQYGGAFMRCGPTTRGGSNDTSVAVPRGTKGRLPWTNQIDLNVAYTPNWAEGLTLKMDIFNVLNSRKVTSVNEVAEVRATGLPSQTYLLPLTWQQPRQVRFMVQYDF
ncbi:TonB-dependent receptor [Luteimonas gilva]|uniref:TonB-dependent receptor n=1 Tax=Luteimonas gilva TaxID=2572684 RepID=A0A4U5JMD1_9GAMM|nr:TonB-dependent receptor [Luteimonas gilva]TKR30840.1 TonB-dependent receptor [Luteimonas gilva]